MAAKKKSGTKRAKGAAGAADVAGPSPAEIGGALGAGVLAAVVGLVTDIAAGVERRHAERLAFDEKKLAQETETALKQLDYAEKMDMYFDTFAKGVLDWMDSKNAVKS